MVASVMVGASGTAAKAVRPDTAPAAATTRPEVPMKPLREMVMVLFPA